MLRNFIATMVIGSFIATAAAQPEADEATGYWYTQTKEAKMQVYKCGDKYCGRIYWMKEPNRADGTPKFDDKNPDKKLQNRKLQGLEIMTGFEYDEDYEWEDGKIYDPKSGSTYSCLMELSEDKNSLHVRGYVGFSLFGRTETWTRTSK